MISKTLRENTESYEALKMRQLENYQEQLRSLK